MTEKSAHEHVVRIAEWSDRPGGARREHGPNSGEEFRDSVLEPAFLKAQASGVMLLVDLDGVYGYAYSFMTEVFGGLTLKYGAQALHDHLYYKSEEEPYLDGEIRDIIATHDTP